VRLTTDRMFFEQEILEGLTKKTFYDSSRIVLTDLEQSLLEKTSTSLVSSHCSLARWHGNKVCYSTSDWTSRSRLFPQLPLGYGPVTPSRRVAPPPCESSFASPARSRAFTGVQRSPKRRQSGAPTGVQRNPKPRWSNAHQALPVRARRV
jgi:hypothetical protein